jgi:hypothetical protein
MTVIAHNLGLATGAFFKNPQVSICKYNLYSKATPLELRAGNSCLLFWVSQCELFLYKSRMSV